jgi:hypothetical protein
MPLTTPWNLPMFSWIVASHLVSVRAGHGGGRLGVSHGLLDELRAVVEVVNGEHDPRVVETVWGVVLPVRLSAGRRLPVVDVDDVRLTLGLQHELERRLGE